MNPSVRTRYASSMSDRNPRATWSRANAASSPKMTYGALKMGSRRTNRSFQRDISSRGPSPCRQAPGAQKPQAPSWHGTCSGGREEAAHVPDRNSGRNWFYRVFGGGSMAWGDAGRERAANMAERLGAQVDRMKNDTSRVLFHYWNAIRGTRRAPRRFEIEPARISRILPEAFILEQRDVDTYRFRIAGTRLCELFGMELRGHNFLELWEDGD